MNQQQAGTHDGAPEVGRIIVLGAGAMGSLSAPPLHKAGCR